MSNLIDIAKTFLWIRYSCDFPDSSNDIVDLCTSFSAAKDDQVEKNVLNMQERGVQEVLPCNSL